MNKLTGTYGTIASPESVLTCSDNGYTSFGNPGWWRADMPCIGEDAEGLTLQSRDSSQTIRIKRDGYKPLGTPSHHVGDRVRVKKSGKHATIKDVNWHAGRQNFYYTLDYGTRVSTNWYFGDDLEAI